MFTMVILFASKLDAAGLTIITHGYANDWIITKPDTPEWLIKMRGNIIDRYGHEGLSNPYSISTAEIQVHGIPIVIGGPFIIYADWQNVVDNLGTDSSGEMILLINWSDIAGSDESVSTKDIAPVIFSLLNDCPYLLSLPIHLIGHSRGGSLMSALADEFALRGIWVDHLTTLDPHPVNTQGNIDPVLTQDYEVHVGNNVLYSDNYYQIHGYPNGMIVEGSYNRFLQRNELSGAGSDSEDPLLNRDHSDVHLWYSGTIKYWDKVDNGDYTLDPPGSLMRLRWYSSFNPDEKEGELTGFDYSRIGRENRKDDRGIQGYHYSFGGIGARSSYVTDTKGVVWPNIIDIEVTRDGNIVKSRDSIQVGESLNISYIGQDYDSKSFVQLYYDSDRNPFNNNDICSIMSLEHSASNNETFSTTSSFYTGGLQPTSGYIYAKITDEDGHTRYLYYEEIINLVPYPVFQVQSVAGTYGSIDLEGFVSVPQGSDLTITATPENEDYEVDCWFLNNVIVQIGKTTYTLNNIQSDCSVRVTFKPILPPALIIDRPATNPYLTGDSSVMFSGRAPANTHIVRWENSLTQSTGDTGDAPGTTWGERINVGIGDNIITFRAYDASDNPLCETSILVIRADNIRSVKAENAIGCTIASGKPWLINSTSSLITIGYDASAEEYKKQRGLIKFTLPELPAESMFKSATLQAVTENNLAQPGEGNMGIWLQRITEAWNPNKVNWEGRPDYTESGQSGIVYVSNANDYTYNWDITEIVRPWYQGSDNNGMYMVSDAEDNNYTIERYFGIHELLLKINYVVRYTISGYVRDSVGNPIAGVLLTVDNDADIIAVANTDTNGYYRYVVPLGWSGRIAPSKFKYAFTATYRNYEGVSNNIINQDYISLPNSFIPKADSYVDQEQPSMNYGSSDTLLAFNRPWMLDTKLIGIQYDLSLIPKQSRIDSVEFKMPLIGGNAADLVIGRIGSPWMESTVNWINKPTVEDIVADRVIDNPFQVYPKMLIWDSDRNPGFIPCVQNWIKNPLDNYGLYMAFPQLGEATFYSREHKDLPPQLQVNYSFKISGHVRLSSGQPISGVTLAGGGSRLCNTDINGYYEMYVPMGWDGIISPSQNGCIFIPSSYTYQSVGDNLSDQDYMLTSANQMGTILVNITPDVASWTISGPLCFEGNGETYKGDKEFTHAPVGAYTWTGLTLSGYASPSSETNTLVNGGNISFNKTWLPQTGSLQVTISPQGAIDAGAQWRRTGQLAWYDSDAREDNVPVGSLTVEFKSIKGWNTPANVPVTINDNQITIVSGLDASYSKWPSPDFDNNQVVDFNDFATLSDKWNSTCSQDDFWCNGTDIDHNGKVAFEDLLLFAQDWLNHYTNEYIIPNAGFEMGSFDGWNLWRYFGMNDEAWPASANSTIVLSPLTEGSLSAYFSAQGSKMELEYGGHMTDWTQLHLTRSIPTLPLGKYELTFDYIFRRFQSWEWENYVCIYDPTSCLNGARCDVVINGHTYNVVADSLSSFAIYLENIDKLELDIALFANGYDLWCDLRLDNFHLRRIN